MTKNQTTFGNYRRLAIAQATNPTILTKAQDSSAVTTLLVYALENRIIDAAITSGKSKQDPLKPLPKLATTPQDITENAGTRYAYSPNIQVHPEANRPNNSPALGMLNKLSTAKLQRSQKH